MGITHHHAIIVTTWDAEGAKLAHAEASRIFPDVTPIVESRINEYHTFLVPPDGSKERWDTSDAGDNKRDVLCNWLNGQRYGDGSNRFKWVEVGYGELGCGVTRHSKRPKLKDPAR